MYACVYAYGLFVVAVTAFLDKSAIQLIPAYDAIYIYAFICVSSKYMIYNHGNAAIYDI